VRLFWNKVRGKSANHNSDYDKKKGVSGSGHMNNENRSQKGSHWNKLGGSNVRLRNDDELELTNDITGAGQGGRTMIHSHGKNSSDEETSFPTGGIMVKNDVEWTNSAR
jgi:hypothetical protein